MDKNQSYSLLSKIGDLFKLFLEETSSKSVYKVVDIFRCEKTLEIKVIIKMSERHSITKSLTEIISDDNIINGLDKKTVRTLTYLCTAEKTQPGYRLTQQKFDYQNNTIFVFECLVTKKVYEYSAEHIIKNKDFLKKLSASDAAKIGYYAGVNTTESEYQARELLGAE